VNEEALAHWGLLRQKQTKRYNQQIADTVTACSYFSSIFTTQIARKIKQINTDRYQLKSTPIMVTLLTKCMQIFT
jgi:hypothetical protein